MARSNAKTGLAWLTLIALGLFGCAGPSDEKNKLAATQALVAWFDAAGAHAETGAAMPNCHLFGLTAFSDASCLDMVTHAAYVRPQTRNILEIKRLACFGEGPKEVCGDFMELRLSGEDHQDRSIQEVAVMKQDNGVYRLYWYRSDLLFTTLQQRAEEGELSLADRRSDAAEARLDAVYTQLVERDPGIYQFVPCLEGKVSTSTLAGALMEPDQVRSEALEERAESCPKRLCLTLVGRKVAALCH